MRPEAALPALALLASACAMPTPAPSRAPELERAALGLTPGRSDRGAVRERLGEPERLVFDSGWEAWAYRAREARNARPGADPPELVLLFDPGGTLVRLRLRPAGAP
ncbi:hypothetical protein [Ramlibacter rhizophilus]|uniref:Outer membrane protein assembly factor BamE n=1 Tax=Ramlibacter rhizophilus TaxID=1781167 RepID=A0A4Z0BCJ5_9BURK|nr:hypothetical protein [Ramlibacter rhizophilus]TFY96450.1 hypothetical protein EZ242_20705 [Ramlibacter rhizophilus]